MTGQEIRLPVLKRLAEQAMSDHVFRVAAREDLDAALIAYGYRLNEAELPLVHRFRDALAEAGVDLALAAELSLDIDDDLNLDDLVTFESAVRESGKRS
jgi:hypothetical protein